MITSYDATTKIAKIYTTTGELIFDGLVEETIYRKISAAVRRAEQSGRINAFNSNGEKTYITWQGL